MRLRPLMVSIVGVLLLADCGSSGDKPSPSPTPTATPNSATPSPTPSPSRTGSLTSGANVRPGETPPVLDKFAKQHNSAGALAFASYFIKALDWSLATTDPYLIKQISAPSCQACKAYINRLSIFQREGGHVRGGRISLKSESIVQGQGKVKADYIVLTQFSQQPASVIIGSASPSPVSAQSEVTSYVYLTWLAGSWRVVEQLGP